jgi:hypothetical protein
LACSTLFSANARISAGISNFGALSAMKSSCYTAPTAAGP